MIDGRRAASPRGGQLRRLLRRRRGRRPPHDAVLRDVRLPGDLPRAAGRPSSTTRSRSTSPPLEDDTWELYDLGADPSETPRPGRPRTPTVLADAGRAVVGRGRAAPRPAPRQPAVLRVRARTARRPIPSRSTYVYWPGTSMVPESDGGERPQPGPPHRRRHRGARRRASGSKGCSWPRARSSAAGRSTCCGAGWPTSTTPPACTRPASRPRPSWRPGPTGSSFRLPHDRPPRR